MAALYVPAIAGAEVKWFEVLGGSWSPQQSDMVAIEQDLGEYVMQQAAARHLRVKPWQMYTFQYQGQGNANSQEIYINAFCTDFGRKDFNREWLIALDGGTCFFRLKYTPATGTFDGIEFNGEA